MKVHYGYQHPENAAVTMPSILTQDTDIRKNNLHTNQQWLAIKPCHSASTSP
jgi:hypothetical protein